MMRQKRRNRKIGRKLKILFFSFLILLCLGGGIFVWFMFFPTRFHVVSPLAQGGLNLRIKSESDEEKQIKDFLSKNHMVFESITRSSDSAIIISLKDNGDVYVSGEKYLDELPSLQEIVSQLTMEGKRFKRLDLRFQRPVIVL